MFSLRPAVWLVLICLSPVVLSPARVRAADAPEAGEKSALVGEPDYKDFRLEGAEADKAEFSVQSFKELGSSSVLHIQTKENCSASYSAQIALHNRSEIHKGDVMLAHFYLRTLQSSLESQEGMTELILEDSKTYTKSLQFGARALGQWREFFVPFVSGADYKPGHASIIFRVGYQPQIIEVAGLVIKDFGAAENLASSPTGSVKLNYQGMAPDAPWRVEAEHRIEKVRKADLTVQVVDEAGNPLPGAEVTVHQTRHAYWFGSAVRADQVTQKDNPDGQARYRGAITEMFNSVTFENDLKWPFWTRNLDATLTSDRWLSEQGVSLRGHTLVWGSREKGLPESLYPLMSDPDGLRKAILDHIREITAKLQPPAAAWDVLNETFNNHEFMDVLGQAAMVTWFQAAREGSPGSRLFINDWGIVTSRGGDTAHQEQYEKTIAYLIDNKAPLDGIGVQGHFGQEPTAPGRLLAVLDRFGRFGKEIQMTEYSTQFTSPEDAATYLRDCLTVFFSHPATTGFILWGFHEGTGMQNRSFLFDKNWNLTPSGKVWKELVYGKWWTTAKTVSGTDGHVTVNGFLGSYSVTAGFHGKENTVAAELKPGGTTLQIVVKGDPGADPAK